MRIIKRGTKKPEKEIKATCKSCGCKFAFLEKESKSVWNKEGWVRVVKCPQCQSCVRKEMEGINYSER